MGQLLSDESASMSSQTPVAFDVGVSHETNSPCDNTENLESDLAEQLQSKPNDERDQRVLVWMFDEPDDDYDTPYSSSSESPQTTASAPTAEGETSAIAGMVVTVASQSQRHSDCTALGAGSVSAGTVVAANRTVRAAGGGTSATAGIVVTAVSHSQGHSGCAALRAGSESVGAVSAASRFAGAAGSALSGRHHAPVFDGESQEAPLHRPRELGATFENHPNSCAYPA